MNREEKLRAVRGRDERYAGVFYCAVKTTKIVCLPTCPARALEKNIVFYDTLQEAVAAGYRPCKRCKPDLFEKKK